MCVGVEIYEDKNTKQLIRINSNVPAAESMYYNRRNKRSTVKKEVIFGNKDITERVKNLEWKTFYSLSVWINKRKIENGDSITLSEYLKQ